MSVRAARVVFPERDRAEIASAITDILTSGVLTLGPYTRTRAFEYAFGTAHQASHAVATSSGTAALEIAVRALKVAGKDVIVPANAFARRYDAGLSGITALRRLAEPAGCQSNFYKYIAVLEGGLDRKWFKEQLATRHDVRSSGEVYDLPLHMQPILEEYSLGQSMPVAEDMCSRHVCLPVHSDMRDDEVDQVLAAVTEVAALPGGEEPIAIAETVQHLVRQVPVVHVPGRTADYDGVTISNRLAKELLSWSPTTPLAEGVRRYLAWLDTKGLDTKGLETSGGRQ